MLTRAIDAGVPAAWASADEFYGNERGLRRDLQTRGVGYVLAVAKSHQVMLPTGTARIDHIAHGMPSRAWNRRSAGKGAKGDRDYDWGLGTDRPASRRGGRPPLAAFTPAHR